MLEMDLAQKCVQKNDEPQKMMVSLRRSRVKFFCR
jgi:hypothetical protein